MTKTILYIDGFNLYYRALKNTPYRWLNPLQLCSIIVPKHEITHIKYFTAKVSARADDPSQPFRQQLYLRALQTLPNLAIHYGHFQTKPTWMRVASQEWDLRPRPVVTQVLKTEEKGSDVNLATHLVVDGFRNAYDAAVVISNDSDLLQPIRVVKEDLGKIIGVLHPTKRPSTVLLGQASFFKGIRKTALKRSQFPDSLTDKEGTFHKPADW